ELPCVMQLLLRFNNTLAGRLTIGPALSLAAFYVSDFRQARAGDRKVVTAWLFHAAGLVPVFAWLTASGFPLWLYAAAVAYPAFSLLMLRTFAEHQAHEDPTKQTAIIEASPVFALLFLNNNLHSAHHGNPTLAWYRLPALCREKYAGNSYRFSGYGELFRCFAFRAKEPVPHPYLRRSEPARPVLRAPDQPEQDLRTPFPGPEVAQQ
ncbi:MAG TPA: fatty acid desaturase, partial [Afifellaceae bacterium]|nr:fatty acid desaturase [Afifellaceae bacterium]